MIVGLGFGALLLAISSLIIAILSSAESFTDIAESFSAICVVVVRFTGRVHFSRYAWDAGNTRAAWKTTTLQGKASDEPFSKVQCARRISVSLVFGAHHLMMIVALTMGKSRFGPADPSQFLLKW